MKLHYNSPLWDLSVKIKRYKLHGIYYFPLGFLSYDTETHLLFFCPGIYSQCERMETFFLQINPLLPENNNSLWQQTICQNFCSKGFGCDYRASLSQSSRGSKTCTEVNKTWINSTKNMLSYSVFCKYSINRRLSFKSHWDSSIT